MKFKIVSLSLLFLIMFKKVMCAFENCPPAEIIFTPKGSFQTYKK